MKKQILALTMCLALTATSALADNTLLINNTVPQTSTAKDSTQTPPTSEVLKKAAPNLTKPSPGQPKLMSKEEIKQSIEVRKAKERALMYEVLQLTDEQKAQAEALDAKTKVEVTILIKDVRNEAKKLRELSSKNASFIAISKQKFKLKVAKDKTEKCIRLARKSFEDILTKEQRKKFKTLQEAKRKDMEQQFTKRHKPFGHKKMKSNTQ